MMRFLLVFVCLLLATSGVAQRDTIATFSNGNVQLKGQFKKNQRDGTWTWYYREGDIKHIANYHKGQLDGKELEYTAVKATAANPADPSKRYRALTIRYHAENQLIKEQTMYAAESDTLLLSEITYSAAGKLATEWFASGQMKSTAGFDSVGLEHGNSKQWTEQGILLYDYTFVHGSLTGDYRAWYTNGTLKAERNEKAGVAIGYHPSGLVDKISYLNTDCAGQECYERYHDTGRKQEEMMRFGDKIRTTKWGLDGSIEERTFNEYFERLSAWYHTGQIRYLAIYLEGTGQNIWYHINGERQQIGFFEDGKRAGRWLFWDEEGNLHKEEIYEKGLLIETIDH